MCKKQNQMDWGSDLLIVWHSNLLNHIASPFTSDSCAFWRKWCNLRSTIWRYNPMSNRAICLAKPNGTCGSRPCRAWKVGGNVPIHKSFMNIIVYKYHRLLHSKFFFKVSVRNYCKARYAKWPLLRLKLIKVWMWPMQRSLDPTILHPQMYATRSEQIHGGNLVVMTESLFRVGWGRQIWPYLPWEKMRIVKVRTIMMGQSFLILESRNSMNPLRSMRGSIGLIRRQHGLMKKKENLFEGYPNPDTTQECRVSETNGPEYSSIGRFAYGPVSCSLPCSLIEATFLKLYLTICSVSEGNH